jgi:RES domain-containing protein
MIVYRITGKKYSNDLMGTGAVMYGGRWNKKGSPVLYTGESKEIALLETIVHTPPMLAPALDILTLEIPDNSVTVVTADTLPENWTDYPAPTVLSEIAEQWIISNTSIALKVPSCIIHTANNYILNCRHPDYHKVELLDCRDFHSDARLKK